jgi:hypothetical protein
MVATMDLDLDVNYEMKDVSDTLHRIRIAA